MTVVGKAYILVTLGTNSLYKYYIFQSVIHFTKFKENNKTYLYI